MSRPSFSSPSEFSGSRELSHAGLSAGVESQLTGSSADIGKAHQFFAPGAEAHALSVSHMAVPIATGAEAAMLPMVPGASEPISPLIQLIMRLPGQIGLFNSFFEALGNFFIGNMHALGLDPSLLDIGAHAASAASGMHLPGAEHLLGADHLSIDSHLLPGDAPILHGPLADHLGMEGLPDGTHLGHSEMLNGRDPLKVGGDLDLSNPKFEGATSHGLTRPGEILSGPNISDAPIGNHLAATQRMFSDRFQGSFFSKPGMHSNIMAGGGTLAQSSAAGGSSSMSSAMNVGGNNFAAQPQALPAVAQAQDGLTGGGIAQANGIDTTGGGSFDSNQLLASNSGAESFKPSTGTSSTDAGSSYLQQQSTPSETGAAHTAQPAHQTPLKALRAKELSLDGVKSGIEKVPTANAAQHAHTAQSAANQAAKTTANAAAKPAAPHTVKPAPKVSDAGASEHGKLLAKHPNHVDAPKPAKAATSDAAKATKTAADTAHSSKIASTDGVRDAKDVDAAGDTTPSVTSDLKPTSYTIRAGDCLWNIAKDHLGSGMKWQEIYKMNQDLIGNNPDLIHTGASIKLPGMNNELASAGAEATKYVVKPGDCLWNIAKDQMHDATKWGDLFHANSNVIGSNARLILPGQELSIPGTGGADVVADASTSAAAAPGQQLAEATSGATSQMSPAADASTNLSAPAMGDGAAMSPHAVSQQSLLAPQAMQAQPISPTQQIDTGSTLQQVIPTMHYNTPALGPGAAGSSPLPMGPGAAGAATLHTPAYAPLPPTDAVKAPASVVTSSFGADLASFLSQRGK